MAVTESADHVGDRFPTSRQINEAIELLKRASADHNALRLLDIWNAHRLVDRAQQVSTHEELANLFTGLSGSRQSSFSE
jgi:hypothetical protein